MEELVKDVLGDKRGAATRFYQALAPGLCKYLLSRLPREEDVEEILQDVFIAAFDSLPLFGARSSVRTWVYSIARHEVADFYRRRFVRRSVEQTSQLLSTIAVTQATPEFEWQKEQIKVRFEQALASLNNRYQHALFLRYEMGMSVREVAERMKLPFKATESLLFRARMAFVEAYEDVGA